MTVTAQIPFTDWIAANGVNKNWSYDFTAFDSEVLFIEYKDGEDGAITRTQTDVAFYPDADFVGGYLQYPSVGAALAATFFVRVIREVLLEQDAAIGNEAAFYPENHERTFDKTVIQIQQVNRDTTRALKVPLGSSGGVLELDGVEDDIMVSDGADGIKSSGVSITSFGTDMSAAVAAAQAAQAGAEQAELDATAEKDAAVVAKDAAVVAQLAAEQAYADVLAEIAALGNPLVFKGVWDASAGTFPGGGVANAGWEYIVSVGGTVDGQVFDVNDRLLATVNNPSTATYAANWYRIETDLVQSVAGLQGAISAAGLRTALSVLVAIDEDNMASDLDTAVPTQQSVKARIREIGNDAVSVVDFGAVGDGVADDSAAFEAAEQSGATRIVVPPGSYNIGTEPTWNFDRTLRWDIDPTAIISGTGTQATEFPYTMSNTSHRAIGDFQYFHKPTPALAASTGASCLTYEMLADDANAERISATMYIGAKGASPHASANVWALNTLVQADVGAAGIYQCVEVDVNCFSASATCIGVTIVGVGNTNPDAAISIGYTGADWARGIQIFNSLIGLTVAIEDEGRGIVLDGIAGAMAVSAGAALSMRQSENGKDIMFLQRATDAAPSGYILRVVNAANSAHLAIWDILGNFATAGNMVSQSPIGGVGYAAGAGGAVTQITSKATGVTLNTVCGRITTHNASLAAGAEVSFTVTNSSIVATDVIATSIASGATAGAYEVTVDAVAAGSFRVSITNRSAGALGEALVINFATIRSVAA